MKTVEQIIIDLENEFLFHYQRARRYEKYRDEVKKYGCTSLQYESCNGCVIQEQSINLFILQLLSDIEEVNESEIEKRLYKKFNLEGDNYE